MSWIGVSVGTGLATSVMSNKARAKENERQSDIVAAQTEFSPWTNLKPQAYNPQSIDAGGDALKAITSGVMAGVMDKNANKKPEAPAAPPPDFNSIGTSGLSAMNGWGMPQQQPALYGMPKKPF